MHVFHALQDLFHEATNISYRNILFLVLVLLYHFLKVVVAELEYQVLCSFSLLILGVVDVK